MEQHVEKHTSAKPYVIGYILSLVLTLIPLFCVLSHGLSKTALVVLILALAVVQMLIQLFFFMHVTEKEDEGPAWHSTALILGLVIIITIVAGSIWIMSFSSTVQ